MLKKNGKDLLLILIVSVLAELASHGMGATNLVVVKIVLFCLSVVFSIVGVICSIRLLVRVFISPSEDEINEDRDQLILKKKIITYIFAITFLVVITVFCILYFWFI